MQQAHLVQAHAQPNSRGLLSLPANLTTAMTLVDYALHNGPEPASQLRAIAQSLPEPAKEALELLRTILAHGTSLGTFWLARIPGDDSAQRSWPALRGRLATMSDDEMRALVDHGIIENLRYYLAHLRPQPEVEWRLAHISEPSPNTLDTTNPRTRRIALRSMLASWNVERTGPVIAFWEDPVRLRETLLAFLDALWDHAFGAAWEDGQPALADIAAAVGKPRGPLTPEELILQVTGLLPNNPELTAPDVDTFVFAPCLWLGSYVSFADLPSIGERYIFYEPAELRDPAGQAAAIAPPSKPVDALAEISPALEALGEGTRLRVLVLLAGHDWMFTQQVADALGVHQSTVSRHFAQLEHAGLVHSRREGSSKHYRLNRARIRQTSELLARLLG